MKLFCEHSLFEQINIIFPSDMFFRLSFYFKIKLRTDSAMCKVMVYVYRGLDIKKNTISELNELRTHTWFSGS